VTVAGGGDNLRDPFNPVSRADPLETASLLVTAGHLTPEEAYTAVSTGARAAMGLPEVQVAPGFPAELLAIQASSLGEAIAGGTSRVVIHRGRVASRTTVTRDYPDPAGPPEGAP
jgi:cytosine deaminase